MIRPTRLGLAFGLALGFAAGCNRYQPYIPKTVPAGGKVILASGEPLRSGMVTFMPEDITEGREVGGMLDGSGSFKLDWRDGGAVPGKYIVTIDPGAVLPGKKPDPKSKSVPAKFKEAQTSTLRVEIKAESPNDFRIRLN